MTSHLNACNTLYDDVQLRANGFVFHVCYILMTSNVEIIIGPTESDVTAVKLLLMFDWFLIKFIIKFMAYFDTIETDQDNISRHIGNIIQWR